MNDNELREHREDRSKESKTRYFGNIEAFEKYEKDIAIEEKKVEEIGEADEPKFYKKAKEGEFPSEWLNLPNYFEQKVSKLEYSTESRIRDSAQAEFDFNKIDKYLLDIQKGASRDYREGFNQMYNEIFNDIGGKIDEASTKKLKDLLVQNIYTSHRERHYTEHENGLGYEISHFMLGNLMNLQNNLELSDDDIKESVDMLNETGEFLSEKLIGSDYKLVLTGYENTPLISDIVKENVMKFYKNLPTLEKDELSEESEKIDNQFIKSSDRYLSTNGRCQLYFVGMVAGSIPKFTVKEVKPIQKTIRNYMLANFIDTISDLEDE